MSNLAIKTPASHISDPTTSFEAEAAVNDSGTRQLNIIKVAGYVTENPGKTAPEIGLATGLGHIEAQRRLSDLTGLPSGVLKGLPRKCTVKESRCRFTTWWPNSETQK